MRGRGSPARPPSPQVPRRALRTRVLTIPAAPRYRAPTCEDQQRSRTSPAPRKCLGPRQGPPNRVGPSPGFPNFPLNRPRHAGSASGLAVKDGAGLHPGWTKHRRACAQPFPCWSLSLSPKVREIAVRDTISSCLFSHRLNFIWGSCPFPGVTDI